MVNGSLRQEDGQARLRGAARRDRATMKSATTKRAQQASGIRCGCHVDNVPEAGNYIAPHCVLDREGPQGCVHATRRRVRETCEFWQPWPEAKSS